MADTRCSIRTRPVFFPILMTIIAAEYIVVSVAYYEQYRSCKVVKSVKRRSLFPSIICSGLSALSGLVILVIELSSTQDYDLWLDVRYSYNVVSIISDNGNRSFLHFSLHISRHDQYWRKQKSSIGTNWIPKDLSCKPRADPSMTLSHSQDQEGLRSMKDKKELTEKSCLYQCHLER